MRLGLSFDKDTESSDSSSSKFKRRRRRRRQTTWNNKLYGILLVLRLSAVDVSIRRTIPY